MDGGTLAIVSIVVGGINGFFSRRLQRSLPDVKELLEKDEEELKKTMNEMNKILLKRLLITVPALVLIWWSTTIGTLATPWGEVPALVWTIIFLTLGSIGGAILGSSKASIHEKS